MKSKPSVKKIRDKTVNLGDLLNYSLTKELDEVESFEVRALVLVGYDTDTFAILFSKYSEIACI